MQIFHIVISVVCVGISQARAATQPGYALAFDGVDDVLVFQSAQQVELLTPHTIEAWIRPSRLIYDRWAWIVGQTYAENRPGTEGDNCWRGVGFNVAFNEPRLGYALDPAPCGAKNELLTSAQVGSWLHVAGTFDGAKMKFYVNGNLISSRTATFSSSTRMSAGAGWSVAQGKWDHFFEGVIDEVRIWHKARTQAEIVSTMNRHLSGQECRLAGVWSFDEGSGQTTNPGLVGVAATLGRTGGSDSADPTWIISDLVLAPARCEGDLDDNGLVDDDDFALFVQDYQRLICDASGMPPNCPSDLDGTCEVDDADFSLFSTAYNQLICATQ